MHMNAHIHENIETNSYAATCTDDLQEKYLLFYECTKIYSNKKAE